MAIDIEQVGALAALEEERMAERAVHAREALTPPGITSRARFQRDTVCARLVVCVADINVSVAGGFRVS